jgi:hypothetical protein
VPEGLTAPPRGLLRGSLLLRRWYDARRKPVEEFFRRARIGAAGIRISDLRREEFKEAIGGARALGGDEGRGAIGDGDELVHFVRVQSRRQNSFKFRAIPMKVGLSTTTSSRLSSTFGAFVALWLRGE